MSSQSSAASGANARSVACTIVAKNYFGFARTLAESFCRANEGNDFYILVADRDHERERFACRGAHVLFLEDLGIDAWRKIAFKFDIVELNTNVKATLLKSLLARGYPRAYYFDPDVYLYGSIGVLDRALDPASILLTPHSLSPLPTDGRRVVDRDLLKCGVYNLGFIGVRNTSQARAFLDWWEARCLAEGFNEPGLGLFVDQHWIDLVPGYFNEAVILRHPGCNVAYWNLHERLVREDAGEYAVEAGGGLHELVFFHFSGIDPQDIERVSKHQNRVTLGSRPDLRKLYAQYVMRLLQNDHEQFAQEPYGFGAFANGRRIPAVLRRFYAALPALGVDSDPFDIGSATYRFAKRHRLLGKPGRREGALPNSLTVDEENSGVLYAAGCGLRLALAILGPTRFAMLSKFMRYYGIPNNQARIVFRGEP